MSISFKDRLTLHDKEQHTNTAAAEREQLPFSFRSQDAVMKLLLQIISNTRKRLLQPGKTEKNKECTDVPISSDFCSKTLDFNQSLVIDLVVVTSNCPR